MSESTNNCELCSLLKNLDSSRQPVYNCANLSCQQLSSSSEWVMVDASSFGGADAHSFTRSVTWNTERQVGASWVELVLRQEVSMSGNEGAPSIHRWVNAQGPWNSVEAADRIRAQLRYQELDHFNSLDGAESLKDFSSWVDEEAHEQVLGEFQSLDLALVFEVILKAFGI